MVQLNTFSLLALASSALAAVITVDVGSSGDTFSPDSVTAANGDIVQFTFHGAHSVTQSDFSSPCSSNSDTAINSGTLTSGDFSVEINGTDPIWIFCAYSNHCQRGMTMVINPPSSGDTLDAYTSAAKSASGSSAPSGVQGGIIGDASSFSSSTNSASASSGTSAATSAAAGTGSATSATSSATKSTGTSSSTTSSGSTSTKSSSAEKIQAFGVAGVAGLFAALLA